MKKIILSYLLLFGLVSGMQALTVDNESGADIELIYFVVGSGPGTVLAPRREITEDFVEAFIKTRYIARWLHHMDVPIAKAREIVKQIEDENLLKKSDYNAQTIKRLETYIREAEAAKAEGGDGLVELPIVTGELSNLTYTLPISIAKDNLARFEKITADQKENAQRNGWDNDEYRQAEAYSMQQIKNLKEDIDNGIKSNVSEIKIPLSFNIKSTVRDLQTGWEGGNRTVFVQANIISFKQGIGVFTIKSRVK